MENKKNEGVEKPESGIEAVEGTETTTVEDSANTTATTETVEDNGNTTEVTTAPEVEKEKKEFNVNKEELKNETYSTINQVRETIKKVNFKDDTEETKGFMLEFAKNPINKMKDIANAENSFFKTAIVLLIVWTAAEFLDNIFYIIDLNSLSNFFRYGLLDSLLAIIKATVAPALGVVVLAVILMVMNKERKKSLVSLIATVTLAKLPTILAAVLNLLTIISSQVSKITGPISSFCYVLSTVLLYFGIKELFQEEDDNQFIKTFMIIQAIYFAAKFVISFLGIRI